MSIKYKLILLLVVVSVAPLIIGTAMERRSIRALGSELTEQSKVGLIDKEYDYMILVAETYAASIESRAAELEYAVEVLALAAQDLLGQADPPADARVYDAKTDFNPAAPVAPGVEPRVHTFDMGPNKEPETATLQPSSFETHSTLITPFARANPREARLDAQRLAPMTEVFQELTASVPMVFNAYVSLRSGVHAHYPGHGRYEAGFAPRQRPWWKRVVAERARPDARFPVWTTPFVDLSTNILIITAAQPIFDADGEWIGVAVVDAVMSDLLAEMPETEWAGESGGHIVLRPSLTAGIENDTILRLGSRGMQTNGKTWDTLVDPEAFRLGDPEVQAALAQAMDLGRDGILTADLDEERVMLAYTPFRQGQRRNGDSIYLLMTVPYASIHAPADLMTARFDSIVDGQVKRNATLAGIFLIGVVAIGVVMGRGIGKPIVTLANTAEQLAEGDLSARADVHTSGEVGVLARTFNNMIPRLEDHMRLQRSMALAQEVQQHLLPHTAPEHPRYDVAGYSNYCDETGGDYFDYVCEHDQGLLLVLGDVTGHGIASALLMTTARALLRASATSGMGPQEQLNNVNTHLVNDASEGRFMTLFLLQLRNDGTLTYAAAGHDPAIVYDPSADAFSELPNDGIPLGVADGWTYTQADHPALAPGSVVVIGTDGIWEAFNPDGVQFGKDQLRKAIREASDRDADGIAKHIIASVEAYMDGAEQLDDITLIVAKARA